MILPLDPSERIVLPRLLQAIYVTEFGCCSCTGGLRKNPCTVQLPICLPKNWLNSCQPCLVTVVLSVASPNLVVPGKQLYYLHSLLKLISTGCVHSVLVRWALPIDCNFWTLPQLSCSSFEVQLATLLP